MRKWTYLIMFLCLVSVGTVFAQSRTVTGKVMSTEDGEPVIGASIRVEGTTVGTVTNFDGDFTLSVPADAKTLTISYIGMVTVTLPIQDNMVVNMNSDTQNLDEVIVVAYGTARRSSFTGSASSVSSKDFETRPITTVSSALEGGASGVQVTSSLGQPGESPLVRIRGFGSVNASNAPLFVVDGAVYNGNISEINPSDVESITVLKDAASTSLYGSSAGNGVILITTKKGSSSREGLSLQISQGWSNPAYKDYSRLNAFDYYPMQWEMLKNSLVSSNIEAGEAARRASNEIVGTLKYNPFLGINDSDVVGIDGRLNPNATQLKWADDLDWEDAAYRTGHRQEYVVGWNGKNDNSDTYASIGYLNDKGYMIKTDFERYSARLNYNTNPSKYVKAGLNIGATRTMSNYSNSDSDNSSSYSNMTRFIRNMAPIYPVHKHDLVTGAYLDSDGNPTTDPSRYVYDYDGGRMSDTGRDAIAEAELNNRTHTFTNLTSRTYFTLTPIEGLNITANYAIENREGRRKVYENPYVGDGTAGPGRLGLRSTRFSTETFNQIVSYAKTLDKHNFDVMVGHESYDYKYEYFYSMKTQEIAAGMHDLDNFVNISSVSSYTDTYRKEGYLSRLNYDYVNKYYLSASYRRDGSSRFAKENRWGDFFSVGASWRMSEEEFFHDYSWLNNLKLRGSWGQTGNDAILDADNYASYYPSQTLYSLGINNQNDAGAYFSNLSNRDLIWETQISSDIALEFGLFNKIRGSIEFFNKSSKDLLFNVSLPYSSGVASIARNIGKVRNRGVEFDFNYLVYNNKDWRVSLDLNLTHIKNKITSLPEENRENGIISGSKKYMEGYSMYEFWLRQWHGVNPDNGQGLFILDESHINSDGSYSSASASSVVERDGKILTNNHNYAKYDHSGSAVPSVYGGFNWNVGYKAFDFSAIFSYSLGAKLLDLNYQSLMSLTNYGTSAHSDVSKAWRNPGDVTDVPQSNANATHATSVGQSYSTRWLVNGNYLNLRSLNLSYTFPKSLANKMTMESVRANISAENIFMIKARQGLNPQANYSGITYNEYLPARNITLGLNITF